MASELRLTTADRTLNGSVDPSEAVYPIPLLALDPDFRAFVNLARACKITINLSGGGEFSWNVSRTDTINGVVKRIANPPRIR